MIRLPRISLNRIVTTGMAAVVLCLAGASMVRAQQVSDAAPPAVTAPAAEHAAGPRVATELRPVSATFADSREPVMFKKKKTTIVISTLVLVLCVIILVLLIA
jgi:hypothetical protein